MNAYKHVDGDFVCRYDMYMASSNECWASTTARERQAIYV